MKNKILVIEDDRAISELLCMNLNAAGYETAAAYDGEEARRLLLWHEDADLALMESLLVNLIDNAFHAVDKGGRVSVRAGRENGRIFFRVADNGHGIPEKDLDRVTEAFYMADKSRSRQNGGAGLGLALCESIARLHKGKLTVESREGEGTVVSAVF